MARPSIPSDEPAVFSGSFSLRFVVMTQNPNLEAAAAAFAFWSIQVSRRR